MLTTLQCAEMCQPNKCSNSIGVQFDDFTFRLMFNSSNQQTHTKEKHCNDKMYSKCNRHGNFWYFLFSVIVVGQHTQPNVRT